MLGLLQNWMPVIIMGGAGGSLGQFMCEKRQLKGVGAWISGGFVVAGAAFYALMLVVSTIK